MSITTTKKNSEIEVNLNGLVLRFATPVLDYTNKYKNLYFTLNVHFGLIIASAILPNFWKSSYNLK